MKSKNVASDRSRWLKLLGAVGGLSFRFYGLAVDKARIERSSGLQWRKSFYKNVCGRAYAKLMQAYPGLHVRADEHGRTEFMESFATYTRDNHRPTLFDRGTFGFVDGKKEVLVQLADIVAGLLARVYDPRKRLAKLGVPCKAVRYRVRSDPGELPTREATRHCARPRGRRAGSPRTLKETRAGSRSREPKRARACRLPYARNSAGDEMIKCWKPHDLVPVGKLRATCVQYFRLLPP